jgi:beta-aspartyl-peptidase (threonine type)
MFGIAIHGGAGTLPRAEMSGDTERRYRAGLTEAIDAGYAVLKDGGASIDAVTGAVVLLARAVLERSEHVMLAGTGAEEFASSQGFSFVPQSYFHTPECWQQLERIRRGDAGLAGHSIALVGTVGAVALDCFGNLAAATSTGGMTGKRFQRVGDSPIIGAGTYADDRSCAVSATGHGEIFIRSAVAHDICARRNRDGIQYRGHVSGWQKSRRRGSGRDLSLAALRLGAPGSYVPT